MAQKKEKPKPDYDKFNSIDEVDEEIQKYKDAICRKTKERLQVKEAKKEAVGAYNEQLKEIEEELDFSIAVIDELNRQKKLLSSGKTALKSV